MGGYIHMVIGYNNTIHTVDGCENLHQLKRVVYRTFFRGSTILAVVRCFATIHSRIIGYKS